MTIGGIGNSYYSPYVSGYQPMMGTGVSNATQVEEPKGIKNPGESTVVEPGRKSSPADCETCKNRKYQDGSDEMVSFKSPANISPEASVSKVRAHEQEHVSNAYAKASKGNGKVMQASVRIKMAVCPECGTAYAEGGLTTTKIQYPKDKFSQNKKSNDAAGLIGSNFDAAV